MSISNPQTYAEWYWAQQVEANKSFADAEEISLVPFLQGILGYVSDLDGFPAPIAALFNAVGTPGHYALVDIAKGALSQTGQASLGAGLTPLLRAIQYSANHKLPGALAPLDHVGVMRRRQIMTAEQFNERALFDGLTKEQANVVYAAQEPYPSLEDIIRYSRYTTDDSSTKETVLEWFDVNDDNYELWDWLTHPLLSTSDVQQMYLRGTIDKNEALLEFKRLGWKGFAAEQQLDLAAIIPAPMVMIQAGLHNRMDRTTIKEYMEIAGIHPNWTGEYLDAVLAKPNPLDLIRWRLRTDPNLSELTDDLTRLGVHPDYLSVYRELAYPVPPIGDMITMAVREAFSPEIAARFGQYDDYPRDLTRFAAMNGISEEWAQRYWAAHWSLPSPQQGFAMFHRGIINHDELTMLMRALDIMPYWRDKLIEMAYLPLTRVDVRRMYALGVLDETQVEKAYRDIGYSPANAVLLKEYTIKQVLASQTGFKTTDVTSAFKSGYIDRTDAANMLTDLGIKSQNISHILDAGERKGRWDLQVSRMKAIENEYKQGVMNKQGAQSALEALRVPNEKVTALLGQWYKESVERESTPWTKAEVVQFFTRGFISEERAVQELYILGYNDEHIAAILSNASYTKPKASTTG